MINKNINNIQQKLIRHGTIVSVWDVILQYYYWTSQRCFVYTLLEAYTALVDVNETLQIG